MYVMYNMYCKTIQRNGHIFNETELHRQQVRLCCPERFSLIANCRHWHINIPPPPQDSGILDNISGGCLY